MGILTGDIELVIVLKVNNGFISGSNIKELYEFLLEVEKFSLRTINLPSDNKFIKCIPK